MTNEAEAEQIISSLDGMQRASMPQALRTRIIAAIPAQTKRIMVLHRPAVLLIAAGLALLISINIYSLALHTHEARSGEAVAAQANPLADEYFRPAPSI